MLEMASEQSGVRVRTVARTAFDAGMLRVRVLLRCLQTVVFSRIICKTIGVRDIAGRGLYARMTLRAHANEELRNRLGGPNMLKKTLACSIALAALLASGAAMADTKDKKIALVQQLCREFLAPGHAEELGQGDEARGRGGHRGSRRSVHHLRKPGDRTGRANPEPDPSGLQRHRHQRRFAGRA